MATDDRGVVTNHELDAKAYEALPEGKRCGHGKIEPDEFNASFYIYRGIPQNDPARSWSPATSIEDAMGLLDALPGLIGWWTVSYCMVHIHSGEDEPRFSVDVTISYGMDTGRTKTRAITEAFIAAMEASK